MGKTQGQGLEGESMGYDPSRGTYYVMGVPEGCVGKALWRGTKSHNKKQVKLTIQGTTNSITLGVEVCTTVLELKNMLCPGLGLEPDTMKFLYKQSASWRQLYNHDEVVSSLIVKGIKQWTREKATYPHPIAVIGGGHSGLRQALSFLKEGINDFVVYERLSEVGGLSWIVNANTTTKLQTELGVYHLQYDKDYPIPRATMKTQPSAAELRKHFREVCEEYLIMPHVQLETDVTEVKVIIDKPDDPWMKVDKQHIDLCLTRLNTPSKDEVEISTSAICVYPGTMVCPIRLEYKGEDIFGGQLGYGMFNEFDYEQVRHSSVAIIGMGAFGTENVRTCVEFSADKIYLICRRKNIAMPRICSWWINQSIYPPPGAMLMEFMKPMYDLIPDDPWEYYAIMANKDRTTCTIRQRARFGIGDVYFLSCYFKRCEVVVDDVKRLKPRQVLLESGGKLDCENLVKVLGYKPDFKNDKLYSIKEMVGFFINGDWRRWLWAEFPGIDAGKFGGTSFSPGGIANAETVSWYINFPKDLGPLFDSQMLPRKKPDKDGKQAAYIWDARTGSSIGMAIGSGVIPGLAEVMAGYGQLNRDKQLEAHPLEQFVDELAGEWEMYSKLLHREGDPDEPPFPPYPYTKEYVAEMCKRNDDEGEAENQRQMQRAMG